MLVGVTGNLGSGKTTVAKIFGRLGAAIIDADRIVHEIYRKDRRVKRRIKSRFGKSVFTKGSINRKKLGARVFGTRAGLNALCKIVYPETTRRIRKKTGSTKKGITVLDAPTLIESGIHNDMDHVIVVNAAKGRRLKRCVSRGYSKGDFEKRESFQMPIKKKLKYADFVIGNDRSRIYLDKKVKKIWGTLTGGQMNRRFTERKRRKS